MLELVLEFIDWKMSLAFMAFASLSLFLGYLAGFKAAANLANRNVAVAYQALDAQNKRAFSRELKKVTRG
jgi:hypothetical protein